MQTDSFFQNNVQSRFLFLENKLCVVLLPLIISAAFCYIFIGEPIWGTNDDPAMLLYGAGVFIAEDASAGLVFIHPILGWLIKELYHIHWDFPWYGSLFVFFTLISVLFLNISIYQVGKLNTGLLYVLLTILDLSTVSTLTTNLQFTIVAGVLSISGSTLLTTAMVRGGGSYFYIRVAFGILALLVGGALRVESMQMVLALNVIFFPYVVLELCKRRIFADCSWRLRNIKPLIRATTILLLIFLGCHLLKINHLAYYSTADWYDWGKVNEYKAQFIDYSRILCDTVAESYSEHNSSTVVGCKMIMNWAYVDKYYFAHDKIAKILSQYQGIENLHVANLLAPAVYQKAILALANLWRGGMLSIITSLALIFIIIQRGGYLRPFILFFVPAIAVIFYVSIYLARPEFRVLILIVLFMMWNCAIFASSNFFHAQFEQKTIRTLANKKILFFIIVLIYCGFLYVFVNNARNQVRDRISGFNNTLKEIADWKLFLQDDSIVISFGGSFCFECLQPLRSILTLKNFPTVIATGWPNQTPQQIKLIESHGLPVDGFYFELSKKNNVFVIRPSKSVIEVLKAFYKNEFNINIEFLPIIDQHGLHKLVFKPL